MLGLITVKLPLINEHWQMPIDLKESLYKHIFEDPYHITEETYLKWLHNLSEEDRTGEIIKQGETINHSGWWVRLPYATVLLEPEQVIIQ